MSYNKETGLWEGYIYKIINDVNDKVYIGQTIRTIEERFSSHKSASKNPGDKDCALYRAMRKHGDKNFHIFEIEKNVSKTKECLLNKLNEREIYWIDFFNSYHCGYNETLGGENVSKKIFVSVDQYDKYGNLLNIFKSIREASEKTGVHESSITMCINHKNKTGGGYIWVRHGENPNLDIKPLYSKIIKQYDLQLNLISVYNSVTEAANTNGFLSSGISAVLNNCEHSYKGFIWVDEDHEVYYPKQRYKKIIQYDSLGNIINIYKTAKEAEDNTGIDASSILLNCHGIQLSAGYYIWRFEHDEFKKYELPNKMRPVCIKDEVGKIVKIFNYIKQGAEYFNIKNTSNIYQSIKFKVKCHGYYWEYYNINQ